MHGSFCCFVEEVDACHVVLGGRALLLKRALRCNLGILEAILIVLGDGVSGEDTGLTADLRLLEESSISRTGVLVFVAATYAPFLTTGGEA